MSFSINFVQEENGLTNSNSCIGQITIGSFIERFESPLLFWGKNDYQVQWKEALDRLLRNSESCLITSIYDPRESNFLLWWLLYKKDNDVLVHHHVLLFDQLDEPFDLENPYAAIPAYRAYNEDGQPISEWTIPLDGIMEFLTKMSQ